MTELELKELVGALAIAQKETDRLIRETGLLIKERARDVDRRFEEQAIERAKEEVQRKKRDEALSKEEAIRRKKIDQHLKELGNQIGGLGKKFGGFTEGMAFPSMEKILSEKFHMEVISPRVKARKGSKNLEIDVLAYSNSGLNEVYIVETKRRLRGDGVEQMLSILQQFSTFFPIHAGKRLYGILAAVDIDENAKVMAQKHGLYLARIHDEIFDLQSSPDFTPKDYQAA